MVIIREMQVKTIPGYHFMPIRLGIKCLTLSSDGTMLCPADGSEHTLVQVL